MATVTCGCLFLHSKSGNASLHVNSGGGIDVRDDYAEIILSMTKAEREKWQKSYKLTSKVWDLLIEASRKSFFDPGEIVTPYRQIIWEEPTFDIIVRLECSQNRTCMVTTKSWLHTSQSFLVHDDEKQLMENWFQDTFM